MVEPSGLVSRVRTIARVPAKTTQHALGWIGISTIPRVNNASCCLAVGPDIRATESLTGSLLERATARLPVPLGHTGITLVNTAEPYILVLQIKKTAKGHAPARALEWTGIPTIPQVNNVTCCLAAEQDMQATISLTGSIIEMAAVQEAQRLAHRRLSPLKVYRNSVQLSHRFKVAFWSQ